MDAALHAYNLKRQWPIAGSANNESRPESRLQELGATWRVRRGLGLAEPRLPSHGVNGETVRHVGSGAV